MNQQQSGKASVITLAVIAGICGLLFVMYMMLPKGFKDDLTLIGQGAVTVVLTHDKNLLDSVQTMELLNEVRAEYEGRVEFLAVDVATPVGQGFVREQRVGVVNLVIFGPDGARREVVDTRLSEQQLRSVLDAVLSDSGA